MSERIELVMTLVFSNDNTFRNISKYDVKKLLLFGKISLTNNNIVKRCNHYYSIYIHNNLYKVLKKLVYHKIFAEIICKTKRQQFDKLINGNIIADLEEQKHTIIRYVYKSPELIEIFTRMLIEDYCVYVCNNNKYCRYFDAEYFYIMLEYGNIIDGYSDIFNTENNNHKLAYYIQKYNIINQRNLYCTSRNM